MILLASPGPFVSAQGSKTDAKTEEVTEAYLREHYVKLEHPIPMRDGVRLFTAVYAPKDDSQAQPILLTRTPYGLKPYGVDRYAQPGGTILQYAREKFIFALQDVRGRYASEGQYVHVRPHRPANAGPREADESTDAYDTIEWLVRNVPGNNGKVGMMGISYPGFYSAAGMIDSHPALKCASPQAPVSDWFIGDDFHHNGAFYLPHAFRFFSGFGQTLEEPTRERPKPFDFKTPDGYEFYLKLGPLSNIERNHFKGRIAFWTELMEHGTYDEFWRARDLRPYLKDVKTAVMTVGGWFDAEDLFGALQVYRAVEAQNPGIVNVLVMGPWSHGGWARGDGDRLGHVRFHAKTAEFYREEIELPFLKHFLKDGPKLELPEAYVFETGTCRWRRYDSWPPKDARQRALHFGAGGKLSFEPAAGEAAGGFDEYVSDPAKPVPFIPDIAIGMTNEHMLDDQRFASSRPDVLVYQTEQLEEDVTLAGPITAHLQVSTTGTDSDWVVKLIDVYSGDHPNPEPNTAGIQMGGYQQLVRGEAMRGKFRNSFSKPEPFQPGERTKVEYVLPDAFHTFRRGHRIMVHVQSSWFPLVDRNPQTFCDIYRAREEDFRKATQRVYRSPDGGSHVRLSVLAKNSRSSPPTIPVKEEARMRSALTLYASFDKEVRGDFGRGVAMPSTRRDDPEVKGAFIFKEGIDEGVFRIAKGKGVHGGALEAVDVLPHRGRIFFPAKGNLAYRPGGWGGAVSFWLNTDPNKLLKTPFCDPVQITQKGANDGGLWIDFPDKTPRDLRLGVFPAAAEGQKPTSESDPQAPLVQVKDIGFKSGDWHHLVMSWDRMDSEKEDAIAELYIDGEQKGRLEGRKLAMRWDLDHTGIYFAVNYIGLLDELAVFNRPLTPEEVRHLHQRPDALAGTR